MEPKHHSFDIVCTIREELITQLLVGFSSFHKYNLEYSSSNHENRVGIELDSRTPIHYYHSSSLFLRDLEKLR